MGDLSLHFDLKEFACRDCGRIKVDPELVNSLEELRRIVQSPVVILDGYRCPEHNTAVGGVGRSQHLQGTAADIKIPGLTLQEMYSAALRVMSFKYGGIGAYDEGTLHVDVRLQLARWSRIKGVYGDIHLLVQDYVMTDAVPYEGGE